MKKKSSRTPEKASGPRDFTGLQVRDSDLKNKKGGNKNE